MGGGKSLKRLWKLPEPWTRRARAHPLVGKLQNSFPQLPHATSTGDISIELRTGTFLT
jgi:hypothetical protein